MSEAWIYIDESQAPHPGAVQSEGPFWLGALITRAPIEAHITTAAMAELAADPDAAGNDMDLKTLTRGYFHASLDSKNAHSALCRAIVEQGLSAYLSASQWFFDRDDSEDIQGARLHRLTALLRASSTFQRDYDAVHLSIARRAGSFEDHHAQEWLDYCRQTELFALVGESCPSGPLPARHHRSGRGGCAWDSGVRLRPVGGAARKAGPSNARSTHGDTTWLKRLKLRIAQAGGLVAGAHQGLEADLGTWERRDILPAFQGPFRALEGPVRRGPLSDLVEEITVSVRTAAALAPESPRIRPPRRGGELNQAVGALAHLRAEHPQAGAIGLRTLLWMRAFLLVRATRCPSTR